MTDLFRKLWSQEEAQDIAEYAVMLAVILVIVVGTLRLIGGSANNGFRPPLVRSGNNDSRRMQALRRPNRRPRRPVLRLPIIAPSLSSEGCRRSRSG